MTDGLAQIQEKSRLTYRYWPIYLVMRIREVEQHLDVGAHQPLLRAPTGLPLLRQYGLWHGETETDLPALDPLSLPEDADLHFTVDGTDDGTIMSASATADTQQWRLDLMRVPDSFGDFLHRAAAQFEQMVREHSAAVALETARLWSALHGARPLGWREVLVERDVELEEAVMTLGVRTQEDEQLVTPSEDEVRPARPGRHPSGNRRKSKSFRLPG